MAFPPMEHVTSRERALTTVGVLVIYLVTAFSINSGNPFLYICFCVALIIALTRIQKHFLLYLDERRCKAKEDQPEVSPDDDSDEN